MNHASESRRPAVAPRLAFALAMVAAISRSTAAPYSLGNQLTIASTESAGTLVIERLTGTDEVSETVSFRIDASYTHAFSQRSRFGFSNRSGNILQSFATASWDKDDHWSFGAIAGFSPGSATASTIPVSLANADGSTLAGDADLRSRTWSTNAELSVEYDTAGEGAASTVFGLAVGGRLFESSQRVNRIVGADGRVATIEQLRMYCATSTCSSEVGGILTNDRSAIVQLQITGDVTETLWSKTDLDIATTYYLYTTDPLRSGLFALSTLGRSDAAGLGLPAVPLRVAVAPALTHRFGHRLSVTASGQYGRYVDGQGWNALAGSKARVRLGDWQLSAAVVAQRDVIAGAATVSKSISLGASYSF